MLGELPLVIFDFEDASGSTAAMQIRAKAGTEPDVAMAAASGLASALSGMSGAIIRRVTVRYGFVPGTRPFATGATPVQQGAAFIWQCADGQLALVYVPGVRAEYFAVSGPGAGVLLNRSDTDVAALLGVMALDGFTNPFGKVFETILATYRQDRP